MSAAAAPARPRLLHRPVSEAQRQASRRNGARSRGPRTPAGKAHSSRNARRHGFYAKLHLFTPEETDGLADETRYWMESFHPTDPFALALVRQAAFAAFQWRRVSRVEAEFEARSPHDIFAIVRLLHAFGPIETRFTRLLNRSLHRLEQLAGPPEDAAGQNEKSGKGTRELIENNQPCPASPPAESPPSQPLFPARPLHSVLQSRIISLGSPGLKIQLPASVARNGPGGK
jgi:hypothetical protein